MSITIEREGSRIYISGDTFAIKDRLKALGCHPEPGPSGFRWWIGVAKAAQIYALVDSVKNADPNAPKPKQDPNDIRLTGKGIYKGRTYYAGSMTRDGLKVRLLTLPDKDGNYLDFWALCSEVEQTKVYQIREYRGQKQYTTLGSIFSFIERQKNPATRRGECTECGAYGPSGESCSECGGEGSYV